MDIFNTPYLYAKKFIAKTMLPNDIFVFPRFDADRDDKYQNYIISYPDLVAAIAAAIPGAGVTSVTLNNLNPLFTVANTGTVTDPIFTFTAVPQNANLVYAGPAAGPAAAPSFRALTLTDLPALPGSSLVTCQLDFYVTNINSCSPLHINPSNGQDVYIGEAGGNVGIGTATPLAKLGVESTTGSGEKLISLYSTDWATPSEQERFYLTQGALYARANMYDFHAADGGDAVFTVYGSTNGTIKIWSDVAASDTFSVVGSNMPTISSLSSGFLFTDASWNFGPTPVAPIGRLVVNHTTEGQFLLQDNGYLKNTGINGAYMEYDPNSGLLNTVSTTHTRTGFHTDNAGTFVEMVSGGGKGYFNTNGYIEWYANDTGILSARMDSVGQWGFNLNTGIGTFAPTAKIDIQGVSADAYNFGLIVRDYTSTELLTVRNDGYIGSKRGYWVNEYGTATAYRAMQGDNISPANLFLGYYNYDTNPNNTGQVVFALGWNAGFQNSGSNVLLLGQYAGLNNTYSNTAIFGESATGGVVGYVDYYFGTGPNRTNESVHATSLRQGTAKNGEVDKDMQGATLSIVGAIGTGTGLGGDIYFKVARAGLTGSTQNTLINALRLKQSGYALFNDTIDLIGFSNTLFFGNGAGNTVGALTNDHNIGIGRSTLSSLNGGYQNVGVGSNVFQSVVAGGGNVGMGYVVGFNTTGSSNALIGYSSMFTSTTGSGNSYLGAQTGADGNGSFNVFLGYYAGKYETGSNTLIIDSVNRVTEAASRTGALIYGISDFTPTNQILSFNAKVGIGTLTPSARLHVVGYTADSTAYTIKAYDSATNLNFSVRNDGYTLVSSTIESQGSGTRIFEVQSTTGGTRTGFLAEAGFSNIIEFRTAGVEKGRMYVSPNSEFLLTTNLFRVGDYSNFKRFDINTVGDILIGDPANIYSQTARLHVLGSTTDNTAYALKVGDSVAADLFTVRNDGRISMPSLQTGNAGLATGDLYVDTAANILANGDYVVGMKL